MIKKIVSAAALFFMATIGANAATIQVETADLDANIDTALLVDLAGYWDTLTPSTSNTFGLPTGLIFNGASNNNTIFKLTATFDETEASEVDFQAGLDAGYGAEVYVNGTQVFNTESNLWWSRNWNNNAVITLDTINFSAGVNTIEVYWAEDRNSGGNSFRANVKVSTPGVLSIFALGLIALAFSRSRK
ncbi:hypothetical protein KJ365_07205 [Glaciecola sp. XM2]|uniref:hypothetical protein n=1 Tax=Glaciecola sp. XM2 TaxID=1914931 RepID=UPI001BDE8C37|nr:hypothetical protein [Glaciecola sp. XM2]MBT1450667.1 hypothetical protein [Glaciecola sp. XM2]